MNTTCLARRTLDAEQPPREVTTTHEGMDHFVDPRHLRRTIVDASSANLTFTKDWHSPSTIMASATHQSPSTVVNQTPMPVPNTPSPAHGTWGRGGRRGTENTTAAQQHRSTRASIHLNETEGGSIPLALKNTSRSSSRPTANKIRPSMTTV